MMEEKGSSSLVVLYVGVASFYSVEHSPSQMNIGLNSTEHADPLLPLSLSLFSMKSDSHFPPLTFLFSVPLNHTVILDKTLPCTQVCWF